MKAWNEIRKEKICLRHEGKVMTQESYRVMKSILRKGVRIDYRDMLKIRKFIGYSMICSIDKGRANFEYIKLMKEMKISNRIECFEDWLSSKV
jgi:hypothetical protein